MTRKYRFVLLPLITGLMVALITIVFAVPKIKTVVEVKGRLPEKKEKLSRLTEKVAFLEKLDAYELENKVVIVEKALPSKKAVVEILAALSSTSLESGVSFVGFGISPGKLSPEKFEELSFKATFEGPIESVKDFLERMGEVLPVMNVVAFKIKEEKVSLEIESYFSPLPKSLGKIDTPLPKISQKEEGIYRKIAQFKSFERALPTVPTGKEDPFSGF